MVADILEAERQTTVRGTARAVLRSWFLQMAFSKLQGVMGTTQSQLTTTPALSSDCESATEVMHNPASISHVRCGLHVTLQIPLSALRGDDWKQKHTILSSVAHLALPPFGADALLR